MFRPASNTTKKGDASESDSDWDTTADFPAPGHGAGDDKTDKSDDDDDDLPVQPKSKTRSALTDKGREDKAGDGGPHSSRGEKLGSASSVDKRNTKTPASASAVHLSPFDSDSREASPVPPFTYGFQDLATNKKKSSPFSSAKERKGNRFEMSPTPKVPASMEGPIPKWDDSDAEQQTLEELRATMKREKTRESRTRLGHRQIQEGGDNSQAMEQSSSVKENLSQGKEDKVQDRDVQLQNSEEPVGIMKEGKKGTSCFPASWLQTDGAVVNHGPPGENPYQPFIIKNPDGKRFMYCFSEGSTAFYEVVEEDSEAVMPRVAEKVEGYIKRGWQEFFSVLRIVTSIFIFLAIEALSFVTNHIARPLFLGLVMTSGNRLVKPLLAGLFNLFVQPVVIFLWNVMSGFRHACQPLIDILGGFVSKIAVLVQAFRLVEVNLGSGYAPNRRVMGLEGGGGRNCSEVV